MLKVLFLYQAPDYQIHIDDGRWTPIDPNVGPEIESGWLLNIPTMHGQINCFTLKAKIENSLCNGTFTEWKHASGLSEYTLLEILEVSP